MQSVKNKSALIKSGLVASVLLLTAGTAFAQSTINLTAAPQTATMPDGTIVPMWGLVCGTGTATTLGGTGTPAPVNNATATGTATVDLTAADATYQMVTAVGVTSGGTGYTAVPTVTLGASQTTGGAQATATANMGVGTIPLTAGGSGYSAASPPLVTISPPTAATTTTNVQAVASATVSATGVITAITVTTPGSGYLSPPTVSIAAPTSGTAATLGTPTLTVTSATVNSGGSGYTSAPSVAFSGGGGPGALAAASCTQTNGTAQLLGAGATTANPSGSISTIWQPPLITVPVNTAGATSLTINLTNNLSFLNSNTVPTSLTFVGQLGGGLGTPATVASPAHNTQTAVTWSTQVPANFTPPTQGNRVQSFGTEVAATGATLATGQVASGSALTWSNLQPGTYLIESGTHPSIQGPMGLYGILVVTSAPTSSTVGTATTYTAGTAYPAIGTTPAVTYGAEVAQLFSEIDPVQNNAVNVAVNTVGFSETKVWSGLPGGCGNPVTATGAANTAFNTCYPPAANYTPIYYMIDGLAFNGTLPSASLFPALPGTLAAPVTGTVLVRMVNAGLRMHVPAIVGSQTTGFSGAGVAGTIVNGFTLIAEDGNPVPGAAHVQSEVFMAAGKTYDVMINVPAATSPPLAVYDRELSLSGNQIERNAGMLAYIGVNGAALPAAGAFSTAAGGGAAPPKANPDIYNSVVAGQTLTVSDPTKGVIANDVNVYGVKILGGTATTVGGASATTMTSANGTLTLMGNGTFSYTPTAAAGTAFAGDSFTYCANGTVTAATLTTAATCSSGITTTITLNAATLEAATGITCTGPSYTAATATYLAIKPPGVLAYCTDAAGYPLTVDTTTITATGATVIGDANGGFDASLTTPCTAAAGCPASFTFQAKNSQGTHSAAVLASLTFPAGSGLSVSVLDPKDPTKTPITDYRWIIEEDRTFYVDPNCTTNPPPAGCPTANIAGLGGVAGIVPTLGVNFHTSYMPYLAQGCTGPKSCEGGQMVYDPTTHTHINAVCDVGNGVCRSDTTGNGFTQVLPGQVALDPTKRYYLSVLPGDAADPFYAAGPIGHGMGGAPIAVAVCDSLGTCRSPISGATCTVAAGATSCQPPVTVLTQASPYPTAHLSVFVFEDDAPLNGEHDSGGGTGPVNTNWEPGLGQFQIHMWDAFGGNGDFTGQMGFDMFNQPLSNGLAGTKDPLNGNDACPIAKNPRVDGNGNTDPTATGITGFIVTCPEYESDGVTPSPLAGQAVVENLMPGRWGVIATPGADRIARGEEWLQTNTLDGQKAHDSFTRIGEPSYFQEYGPAGYHVSIGFANPAIINGRKAAVCAGTDPTGINPNGGCLNTIKGRVVGERLSRTPDERLYGSGSHDAFAWTQCYVSFGDPDGEDFAFTKCDADGNWTLTGLPDGDWRVTTFDQWNDALVDGLSTPVRLGSATCTGSGQTCNIGDIATTQWQANLYTKTFIDDNRDGIAQSTETGIPFLNVAVRLRDGSLENLLLTDFTGVANFNETFPLFSWYTVETDVTRYKNTGTHVVYDVGGPADGSPSCGVTGYPPCGTSTIGKYLANTAETISLPTNLRVPGAVYCAGADCTGKDMSGLVGSKTSDPPSACTTATTAPFATTCSTTLSSGRIDPPWVGVEGWQGFPGQNSFIEFGKAPYFEGENGGIHGHVVYASTRPFDDPQMLVQTQWTTLIPHVKINLYQEGVAADGVTPTLTLVDTTQTSSWDDWAQGFRSDGVTPNMNCPGQGAATGVTPDLFFFSLYNQPNYLDLYNKQHAIPGVLNTAATPTPLPNNSQFKCYDGMHNWNQVQPAPYDGMYQFPSVTSVDANGRPNGTNCSPTVCIADPVPASGVDADPLRHGLPMLPPGKYVVEVVLPAGYELVKEEDKNILIGDNFIAPVTQQFGGLGNVFIIPDQASVATAYTTAGIGFNANTGANGNGLNPTQSFGASPNNSIVPAFVPEPTWPCVGELRIVPDFISLFPQSKQMSPFAGASRHLCDRKEVTLSDQTGASAKFWLYTSTHIASKFTGGITDDYTSEFDPFSPVFGEKFAPPDLPVSVKDWTGTETNRVYADHWGSYDGMTYSTWEVNPPNPTGYAPTMMVFCMNDPGPIPDTRPTILNPLGVAVTNPTLGKMITDPAYTPGYSQFCYELPFMPGATQYLDTPVVPTSAFAGAGYNNPDCAYPDATPAVKEVDGDGIGPYVSQAGHTLTIYALGDQMVPNNAYAGPSATTAPYNQKTIRRHYGFGSQNGVNGTTGSVTIGGVAATIGSWSDSQITVTVPSGVPDCPVQQQAIYNGSAAQCGELVITNASAQSGGQVTGVSVTPPPATNRGGTYTGNPATPPSVSFSGGGGTGAVAHANLGPATGSVASVQVSSGGSGYTAPFTVTFSGGGGTGAHGTATVRKHVTAVTITNAGSYACSAAAPTVSFSGAGGGGGVTATGTVQLSACPTPAGTARRTVTGVTITNPTTNNYAIGATINVTFSPAGGGGTRALGNTTVAGDTTGFVSSVTMTGAANSGGSGYSTAPTPVFPAPAGGTAAVGTSTLSASRTATVVSVSVTSGGSGYTSAPTVTFSGPATTRARGTATINGPVTTFAGRRSIDAVTVTIGGKAPTHVSASQTIQSAIDGASPGDLIIIDPACSTVATTTAPAVPTACQSAALSGTTPSQVANQAAHNELLIMWKPVRLQGVGAPSSVIDATTHPSGQYKLDAWRQQITCLFGLGLNGSPVTTAASGTVPPNPYDPTGQIGCPGTGWNYYTPSTFNPQVDRLPLEATVGWDANLNGNLAEQLQEPSLMGALEGAGITVLAKGVNFPSNPYDPTLLAGFPTGTTLLQNTMSNPAGAQCQVGTVNPFPSNFSCNPSSIDAVTITQSSQGGGGIFVHGWGHNIQIANNRIYSNAGTLSGGINVGQGEYPPAYIQGNGALNAAPGSCEESPVAGAVLPYCHNVNVNIHHNYVSLNSSNGDELFSATPAGAGGVSICTGSDYYKFNYNWVCGNLSSGDGGGLGHLGFSYNGDIEHNAIILNQSTNPTIPSNGGGLIVMGTPDADIVCNNNVNLDADCPPPSGSTGGVPNIVVQAIGPSDGVGPGLTINANLIMGNAAESGTGGGIAFQAVNGSDMVAFPDDPGQWNAVTLTNNIIVDNVAGWDGAGISLVDSPNVNIINNTIAFNASTASSGMLFNTLGGPIASQQGPTCTAGCGVASTPQVAGVVALQNSAVLAANLAATPVVCPPGHYQGTGANAATNGACRSVSYPKLENNIIWHNSSYQIGVGAMSPQFQQNVVTLYNASFTGGTGAAAASQTFTGQCMAGASYWDIGVRGDTGPGNHSSGFTLSPTASVLTSGAGGGGNSTGNPNFVSSYCDGARTPPETPGPWARGWQVPPGIADATVPNPAFNLTPVATVDEGNNWVNMAFGPLAMSNPTAIAGPNANYGGGLPLGNYSIMSGSSAAGRVTGANFTDAPAYDFFDNPRKPGGSTDSGAVRLTGTPNHSQFTVSAAVIDFGFVPHGSPTTLDQDIVVTNSDVVPLTGINVGFSCAGVTGCNLASFSLAADVANACVIGGSLGAGESCVLNVVFNPTSTSQAARNANLIVTAGGLNQTVSLTGHDAIATIAVSPATQTAGTPPMVATPPNIVAVTGTITVTNTSTRCDAAGACLTTGIPAGYPAPSVDAGPFIPTAITLTPLTGTGTWALAGTCAVGTAINPGMAAIPANAANGTPASAYVPSGNCTVTATYTPPVATCTATAPATCAGTARVTMAGYGTAGATQPATIINRVINAN